jgi:cadmium resistance protein CadD (predicted permease)
MSALSNLLTVIVPIALVAAISPTSFTVMILLLSLSKKPKTSGLGFLAGSILIILLAALLGLFAAESASMMTNADINLLPAWINVILGIIILYFGIKISFKKDYEVDEKKVENSLKDKYSTFGFWGSVLLAIGLFTLNLITTILVFFASSQIAISNVNWMGKIISLILLVIITLLLVEIPLIILFLVPQKADKILSKLNRWIQKKGHYLTAGLTIIIGIYILFEGLKELNLI